MTPKTLVAVLLYCSTLTAAGATDLTVTVNGAKSNNGYIVATIFNSESSFLKRPEALASFRIKASQGNVAFTVRNLPPGKYAVGAFHDANDNGKLDTDPTGQPTEVYSFSNDARGTAGPPQFANAAVELGDQTKTVSIKLGF